MDGFYCNATSCIHLDNRAAIAKEIINLLEKEKGCYHLPQLPYLIINPERLRQWEFWDRPPLLIIGLGIGQNGWTVIKTWPNDWLCWSAFADDHPRLSILVRQLECDAFHYRVVSDDHDLLLEANAAGNILVDHPDSELRFSLIEVPELFKQALQVNQTPEILRKKAEYNAELNRQREEGKFDVQLLAALLGELKEADAERIDLALAKAINPSFWQDFDLFYQVYANFQELEEMNIQLLYFHPPDTYKSIFSIYNPPEYWEEIDEEEF